MMLAVLSLAFAGAPVIHSGDPETAVQRVAADSHTAVWELHPVAAKELWAGDQPRVIGAAQPGGCTGTHAANAAVRDIVTKAEKRLLQQEYGEMRTLLAAAAVQLTCLDEPAEASLATRLFFLDGYAAAQMDDKPAALAGFERAQSFQPGMPWDQKLPPDGKSLFDAAAAEAGAAEKLPMYIGPGVTAATLWVDGRLANVVGGRVELGAGQHLVQVLQPTIQTFTVQLTANHPVVIAAPGWLADKMVAMATDPAQRPMLQAAFEQALGSEPKVYLFTGTRTIRYSGKWEELAADNSAARAKAKQLGNMLLASGLTATVVGGAAAGVGWVQVLSRVNASDEENRAEGTDQLSLTEQRTGALEALQPWAWAGTGVAIAGLAATGVGAVLTAQGAHGPKIAAAPYGPDGAWVGLTW